MKTFLLFALVAFFFSSTVVAQVGPKVNDKARPDTTTTEKKTEKPPPAGQNPAKPAAKKEAERPDTARAAAGDRGTSTRLKRALFTTSVVDREPAGAVDSLTTDVDQVYFFTEVVGMEGEKVAHRWKYNGEVQAEIHVLVGGPRWRFYSSKRFLPSWTGEWIVEVIDADGNVMGTKRLVYREG